MATSGSINYALTRNDIITRALQLAGVIGLEDSVDSADLDASQDMLNMMIKHWGIQGLHLWTEERGTLFLVNAQRKYSLGTGGDEATKTSDFVTTTLSADEAAGQTVLSVTDSTGMAASDNVAVALDDNTLEWTTISSVDSSTQITIGNSLDSVASSGARVYSYTSIIERPLDISQMFYRDSDTIDRNLIRLSREEYFRITNKTTAGSPTSFYYEPTLTTGTLYLYPVPDDVDLTIEFMFTRTIEDFDAASDNPDLPQEWLLALTYGLAARLADFYELYARGQVLKAEAAILLEDLKGFDSEKTSIMIDPDLGD